MAEYVIEALYLICAIVQFAACPGFFSTASAGYYDAACLMFALTGLIIIVLSLHTMYEVHINHKETAVSIAGMGTSTRELVENFCYVVASLFFGIGCVLYLPMVNENNERSDVSNGTTLFLIGSFLFVSASFINGLSMTMPPPGHDDLLVKMSVMALGISELGGASFVAGSILFYPQVSDGTCSVESTWNPDDIGTWLYVAGCGCYLVAALLNTGQTYIKATAPKKVAPEPAAAAASEAALEATGLPLQGESTKGTEGAAEAGRLSNGKLPPIQRD